MWHFLYFFPLPHQQGSFLPVIVIALQINTPRTGITVLSAHLSYGACFHARTGRRWLSVIKIVRALSVRTLFSFQVPEWRFGFYHNPVGKSMGLLPF
jgi:hypothetical protein